MKIHHKINHDWMPPTSPLRSDDIDERYEAEVAQAVRKAEKSWRGAQKALERAERRAVRSPEPRLMAAVDELRTEVERRFTELRELEVQMQSAPGFDASNRSNERRSPRAVNPKGTML